MMLKSDRKYIGVPFKYSFDEALAPNMSEDEQPDEVIGEAPLLMLKQKVDSEKEMLDNLIELIVSTPRGSFHPDPDFGFEFWNHEYENAYYIDLLDISSGTFKEICQKSIEKSLQTYAPRLKIDKVEVEAKNGTSQDQSKRYILIAIQGDIIDNPYEWKKEVFIEPIAQMRRKN